MIGVGLKVRKIREFKKLTQDYMAEQLGITQGAYSRMETEDLDIQPDTLDQIADILEVTKEDILNMNEGVIFNNHGEIQTGQVVNLNNHYVIDPKLEALYESKIQLLEKQIQLLEEKLKG